MSDKRGIWKWIATRPVRVGVTLVAAGWSAACAPVTAQYSVRSAAADSVVREAIRRERSIQPTEIPSNTIGVLPLSVVSADTSYAALGFGVAALMANDLSHSKSLVVVERLRLDAVMRELDMAKSGRLDSTTAPRLGRIVGARRVVVGDLIISPAGALQIGSQVANASTGVVDASLSGKAMVTQIFDAEKAMVFRLFDALGITLSPGERRVVERLPTLSLPAFLAYSNGVRAEFARDYKRAITYYEAAATFDPAFLEAKNRSASIQDRTIPAPASLSGPSRAALISTDLVNRTANTLVGSAVDAPVTRQQLITITISVRTP